MINWILNFFFQAKVWFTSDLHFGHKNVISYCARPYADINVMTEAIIKQWNKQVSKRDTVYVIGDFSLAPKWSGIVIPQLNGKKILILGNHDAPFPNKLGQPNERTQKFMHRYLKDGWEKVVLTWNITLKNGVKVLLSHFPYDNEYDERYLEYRPADTGQWLLHGHLHGKYRKKGKQIDVAFDGDLKLWSEDDIIKLMNDKREFIPSPLTDFYAMRMYDKKQGLKSGHEKEI